VNDAAAPPPVPLLLRRTLQTGVRSEDLPALAAALGQPAEADELALACAAVRSLAQSHAQQVALSPAHAAQAAVSRTSSSPPGRDDPSRVVDGRASFLMRLTTGGDQASVNLARMDDVRTLLAVMRAGSLRQRRAATLRIGELIDKGQVPSALMPAVTDALVHLRAFAIAYEAQQVCQRLPGADGRRARAASQAWQALVEECGQKVRAFWDGDHAEEPIMALPDDQRIQLLVRTRDLPEGLVHHLCALIEGCDGSVDAGARAALLGALLNADDPRLLPALRSVLDGSENELLELAARALARIDDPRAHAALRTAYERTAVAEERLMLGGALGTTGDNRALGYVREAIAGGHEDVLRVAVRALAELGGEGDVQAVTELLVSREPAIVMTAVRTLGRIGDARALRPLADLLRNAESSALRAEIEDAQEMVRARMELLGEEAPAHSLSAHTFDTAKRAALVKRKDPATVRMRARWSFAIGHVWLALGALARAVARLEAAAALRPDWVAPVLAVAMAYGRRNESALALSSFRRALEIDRGAVENHGAAASMLAYVFLRRAEAMARDGRADIARGLLEEALSFDLRRAPSDVRFAIEQRRQALGIETG
jgi:HEAT repeat protein